METAEIPLLPGMAGVAERYHGFILDVWGVLHDGKRPYPGVLDCLERLRSTGKRVVILSNAPRRPGPAVARLEQFGILGRFYDGLMTSGEDAYQHLLHRPDAWYQALGWACLHLGPERDKGILEGLDIDEVADPAEANFVLNTGTNMDGETVADHLPILHAARSHELPMVCANPDLVVMFGEQPQICAGALAQAYEELGGEVRWHGKPLPGVYDACFELLGLEDRRQIVGIGDSLRTDVAGAQDAGIDALWVSSGIHAEELGTTHGIHAAPEALAAACEQAGRWPSGVLPGFIW